MSWPARIFERPCVVLGIGLFCALPICAQQPAGIEPGKADKMASEQLTPPQPQLAKPPIDLFRSLLAMTPIDRREALTNRSPEAQKLILAKLQEYQALAPEQRELRLRVTELRWYLLPLLRSPATNRTAQLNGIPTSIRDLVGNSLHEWDKLDSNVQKQLLDNESTVRFYIELAARTPEQRANISASDREQLESGSLRWQALTEAQRQEVVVHFNQFFDLTTTEKQQTLRTLSEPERLQIEKTLRTFGNLSPAQRSQCLRAFQKFASLSPEDRQQFLKNAEKWERMTPTERQSWRNLVSNLSHQPPLPPGLRVPMPNAPVPIPHQPPRSSSGWATNSN